MINYFKSGDKLWLREFAEKNGITFKELSTNIFPTTPITTLQGLWYKRYAAGSSYADALYWYAQAKHKKWEGIKCTKG